MNAHLKLRSCHTSIKGGHAIPLWILLAVAAALLLALWGQPAAQSTRVQEIIAQALALESSKTEGAAMYRRVCSDCHGQSAHGDARDVIPALAGQVSSYLVKQLADMAEGDRSSPDMHRVAARAELSKPQALSDIARYLAALPPLATPEVGDGHNLELGGRIYANVCAQCHGPSGAGSYEYMIPALRGQHYAYVLKEARRLALGHRYSVDVDIIEVLEAMSFEELTAVADYISRLPARARDRVD